MNEQSKNRIGKRTEAIVEEPVKTVLMKLTGPMIAGIVGMVAFNLIDAFFVGKLGTEELAALGYTLPVIMSVASLTLGIGMGTSSVISKYVGAQDYKMVRRLSTDSLILAVTLVACLITVGFFTITPVFTLLGAQGRVLELIRQYMIIWYPGMIFVVFPMVGNSAIRATGDTKTPAFVMLTAVVVNLIMDPVCIFGWGPIPRMGFQGAAIATVFARSITFLISMYVLIFRDHMITFEIPHIDDVIYSWKKILYIGLPAGASRLVAPLATGIVTGIVSNYGEAAVAAYGVSSRIDFFALAIVAALSTVIGPFIGQNLGAGKKERVMHGLRFSYGFSACYSVIAALILFVFAHFVASIFNKNAQVIDNLSFYLRVISPTYIFMSAFMIATSAMHVLNKPIHAAATTMFQMFGLYVPLSFIGAHFFMERGVFGGIACAQALSGIVAFFVLQRILVKQGIIHP